MKKLFLIAVITATLISCKKNNDDATSGPFLSAKVDGSGVSYGTLSAQKQSDNSGLQDIVITGTGNSQTIFVSITKQGGVTPGAYDATGSNITIMNGTSSAYSTNTAATVTVTAIDDTHIEGTFSGTAEDMMGTAASKTITEGKFNVKF